jgi:hypothetical protein
MKRAIFLTAAVGFLNLDNQDWDIKPQRAHLRSSSYYNRRANRSLLPANLRVDDWRGD